jgi:glycosyltransferase involved in cell wall biosynthesis
MKQCSENIIIRYISNRRYSGVKWILRRYKFAEDACESYPVPEISVIMTNYNRARFIKQAVESVLEQTLADIELIVVDDASRDSSKLILNELAIKDSRIRLLFNNSNRGPSFSRNKALKIAAGQYICFVDSDDLIRAERLQKMKDAITATPNCIAYTHVCLIDDSGSVIRKISPESRNYPPEGEARDYILKEWIWAPSTFMIPSSAVKEVGYFDESFREGEDLDYLIRLTQKYKITVIREPLYCYRLHGNSIMGALRSTSRGEATSTILEKVLKENWNNMKDETKYWVIVRILKAVRINHIRLRLKWLLNPFFIRSTFDKQPVFRVLMDRIMEDFYEIYHRFPR